MSIRLTRRQCLGAAATLALPWSSRQAAAAPFKMGLLVPGSVAEEGWNRIAYDALLQVERELDAKISYVELQENPAAFESAFRNYASQGYDVVLGHGFQFQDAALTVAGEFPDTIFLISSSYIHEGNVIGLNTDSSEPFYLMGVIAALSSPSAGLVGGLEIPPIKQAFEGFVNGARSIVPDYPISQVYIGSFTDTTAAKEAAIGMIARGSGIVVPNANAAGVGVIQAVREASADVRTFSVYSDYTEMAPDDILAVYLADYGRGIVRIVSEIKEGRFAAAGNIEFGLRDVDVMKFTFNDRSAAPLSPAIREQVDQIRARIVAGEIATRQK